LEVNATNFPTTQGTVENTDIWRKIMSSLTTRDSLFMIFQEFHASNRQRLKID